MVKPSCTDGATAGRRGMGAGWVEELGGGGAVTGASIGVLIGLTKCSSSSPCQTHRCTWETWKKIPRGQQEQSTERQTEGQRELDNTMIGRYTT